MEKEYSNDGKGIQGDAGSRRGVEVGVFWRETWLAEMTGGAPGFLAKIPTGLLQGFGGVAGALAVFAQGENDAGQHCTRLNKPRKNFSRLGSARACVTSGNPSVSIDIPRGLDIKCLYEFLSNRSWRGSESDVVISNLMPELDHAPPAPH